MVELEAHPTSSFDFPVVYASADERLRAHTTAEDGNMDMVPLLDTIHQRGSVRPTCEADRAGGAAGVHGRPLQLRGPHRRQAVCTAARMHEKASRCLVVKPDGNALQQRSITQGVHVRRAWASRSSSGGARGRHRGRGGRGGRRHRRCGHRVAEHPVGAGAHRRWKSLRWPLCSRRPPARLWASEGDIVGARQLKERLMREAESNISMHITELEDKSGIEVAGRGVLHLSVLMETMRREGYEFQVGRPRVILKKDANGQKLEPIEEATVDVPSEYCRQGHRGVRQRRRRDDRHVCTRRCDASGV